MDRKCRVKGYLVVTADWYTNVNPVKEDELHIYSGSSICARALDMNQFWKGEYIRKIHIREVESMWEENEDGTIREIIGSYIVPDLLYEPWFDETSNQYVKNGEYLRYKGENYKSTNGKWIFSNDYNSQKDGFCMISPGYFEKYIKEEEIEHVFCAHTVCLHNGIEANVDKMTKNKEFYLEASTNNYPKELLLSKGFIDRGVFEKTVSLEDIDKIWTKVSNAYPHPLLAKDEILYSR